jgi:hypothetical protein
MRSAVVMVFLCCLFGNVANCQEHVTSLLNNSMLAHHTPQASRKVRAINLPFVDDFSSRNGILNANLWQKSTVFVNNTFGVSPVSFGVATLDALDANGILYNTTNINASYYADTLQSAGVDMGALLPGDSVYLSFFVQAQGNGFRPELDDSLMVFFMDASGGWNKVWARAGSALTPFEQVMLPIKSNLYFHSDFQFMFINKASPNSNDDVWNIDYVRLASNRFAADTVINDVCFVEAQPSILREYTSMPYWHFYDYKATEQDTQYTVTVRNTYGIAQAAGVNNTITDLLTGTFVNTANAGAFPAAKNVDSALFPQYAISYQPVQPFPAVELQHRYYFGYLNGDVRPQNDTLYKSYPFGNQFAYDDGTAEKAYYLYGLTNFPVSTAIAFHTNRADTLRGIAVKFAQQIPSAVGKKFSIVLYKSLGANTSAQQVLSQEDFFEVKYVQDREELVTYALQNPIALDSGLYYIGTTQQPNTNSDTVYFGLDVNTAGNADHLFYNVDGQWVPSTAQGSLMLRPIVGQSFIPTAIRHEAVTSSKLKAYPLPVQSHLYIDGMQHLSASYILYAASGAIIRQGITKGDIDMSLYSAGQYYITIQDGGPAQTLKIVKQ